MERTGKEMQGEEVKREKQRGEERWEVKVPLSRVEGHLS